MFSTAAKSSVLHLFHYQNSDLLPNPSLFALLKSDQAQLRSFSAQPFPRDAGASSSALEKVNQRGSAGLLWPERRAFAPTWWKMSVPTGAPFTSAKWWVFAVQRGYQADSYQEVNKYLLLCFTAVIYSNVTTDAVRRSRRAGFFTPQCPEDILKSELRSLKSFSSSQVHPQAKEFLPKFWKNVTDGKHLPQTVKCFRSKMMRLRIPLTKYI